MGEGVSRHRRAWEVARRSAAVPAERPRARSADQAARICRRINRCRRPPEARSVGAADRRRLGIRGGGGAGCTRRGRASAHRDRARGTSRAAVDVVVKAGIVQRSRGPITNETQRSETKRCCFTSEAGETFGGSVNLERAKEDVSQAAPRLGSRSALVYAHFLLT